MLIDHIGHTFYPDIYVLRLIGRISFPIFAFLVAEGCFYTRNKMKYLGWLSLFFIISQAPYAYFIGRWYALNILFTFILSVLLIILIDKFKEAKVKDDTMIYTVAIGTILLLSTFFGLMGVISYGMLGVALPVLFYICRSNRFLQILSLILITALMVVKYYLITGIFDSQTILQGYAVLSCIFIALANTNYHRSKNGFSKWFFYIFYPLHLTIIVIISLFI